MQNCSRIGSARCDGPDDECDDRQVQCVLHAAEDVDAHQVIRRLVEPGSFSKYKPDKLPRLLIWHGCSLGDCTFAAKTSLEIYMHQLRDCESVTADPCVARSAAC